MFLFEIMEIKHIEINKEYIQVMLKKIVNFINEI